MNEVRLVGFTGLLAFRYASIQFAEEPSLIKAGHVAVSLDEGITLSGFHPTPESLSTLPPTQDALDYLLQGHLLPGGVYDDTVIFWRADQLAHVGAPTQVWQQIIQVSAAGFMRIERALQTARAAGGSLGLSYGLSGRGPMPVDRDNCATWPRRLGLPIPDAAGRISRTVRALRDRGLPWP